MKFVIDCAGNRNGDEPKEKYSKYYVETLEYKVYGEIIKRHIFDIPSLEDLMVILKSDDQGFLIHSKEWFWTEIKHDYPVLTLHDDYLE